MGVVTRQGIYNSIWSYFGIILGALNTIVLFPAIFEPNEFGLTRVIVAAASIAAQYSTLSIGQITVKFFPFYRDEEKKHNGFVFFMLLVPFIGYLLFLLVTLIFKENIISFYSKDSSLFGDYYNYIIFLTFYMLYFIVFDNYAKALIKGVFQIFLRNVLLRLLWMLFIILYYFKYIDFDMFIFWFVNSQAIILVLSIANIIKNKQLLLTYHKEIFSKINLERFSSFGAFVLLGAGSSFLANYIDVLMIGSLSKDGLTNVAVYSISFYIGSIILVPYTSIMRVAATIISKAWKENDLPKINFIYKQTSNNLLIVGGLIFLGLWLNQETIFYLLNDKYAGGKYVLLFIALAKLFDVSTGVNGQIIQFSSFYKTILYFGIALIVLVVVTNYLLIPQYGIEGAALATLISVVFINLIRMLVIKVKINMMPFDVNTIKIVIVGLLTYVIVSAIPNMDSWFVNVLLRSGLTIILYVPTLYVLNVSKEFNDLVNKLLLVFNIKR